MAEDRPERLSYPFPLPEDLMDPSDGDEDAGVSPFAIFNHLLRHAKWIIGLPLLAFALTALYVNSQDRNFVADSKFLPAKGDFGSSASGSGVLSQLNRLVGGGSGNPDGMFYSFLATSTAFLRPAARTEFTFERPVEDGEPNETEVVQGTLAEIYGYQPQDPDLNTRISLGILKGMVSSRVEPGTGFVAISVSSPWQELAVAVNDRLLELVNQFNVEQRQTQAASERKFVEDRMEQARLEREVAERALVAFLEQNQGYAQSPRLKYEAMQLEAQVELKRNLYSSLAQSYEQARITEVRNTPVVTVVERPEETVMLQRRGNAPIRYGFMAFILVALLTMAVIAARAYFQRQREVHPDDFAEFRRLARNSVPAPLRRRLSALGGRSNGGGPAVKAGSSASSDTTDAW